MLLEKCAELGEKMSYILHYDIAAMVLAVVILIHFYHKKSIRMPQSFAFVWLIWLSLLTDIVDILTVVLDEIRFVPPPPVRTRRCSGAGLTSAPCPAGRYATASSGTASATRILRIFRQTA